MAMKVTSRFQTKQEWLFDQLREAIRTCELKPGERLIMDEISEQFGVSRIPVREALLQLQSEGLVTITPHAGAVVAPISFAAASDYFTISRELQVIAVRATTERLTPEGRRELEDVVDKMEEAAAADNLELYTALNHEFHQLIARLSGMPLLPRLLDEVQQHWQRAERYYGLYPMSRERTLETIEEHRRLSEAILKGDVEAAERESRNHNISGLNEHLRRMAAKKQEP